MIKEFNPVRRTLALMTQPAAPDQAEASAAPPQWSPDGHWWWDGTQWLPGYGAQPSFSQLLPQQPQKKDRLGIASMVLGILWVFSLGSVAAIVTGHLAQARAHREGR